jgi:DNA-binding NtrC family response regulator
MGPVQAVTILAAVCPSTLEELRRIVAHTRWKLLKVATIAEAARVLRHNSGVVLLCDTALPDGHWDRLLRHTLRHRKPPPLIVAADQADDALWMQVLSAGAYNLLARPLQERDVFQVVSNAWLHLRDRKTLTA